MPDSAGNLYGSTQGGAHGCGAVYKVNHSGKGTVLYTFTCGTDGGYPGILAGVILDASGNVYGTTSSGGESNAGVVYKVDTGGHETVLYSFKGLTDGSSPSGPLIRDAAGNFLGTTRSGGASGAGTIYKLDPNGNETILYSFTGGTDGADPCAGVIRDTAGNLYGTTQSGGKDNDGVVFKLTNAAAAE